MIDINEPAYPFTFMDYDSIGEMVVREQFSGLTKRELFAKDLMSAMLSNQGIIDTYNDITIKSVAYRAVAGADFLLEVLND